MDPSRPITVAAGGRRTTPVAVPGIETVVPYSWYLLDVHDARPCYRCTKRTGARVALRREPPPEMTALGMPGVDVAVLCSPPCPEKKLHAAPALPWQRPA